jgi:hypothetical protein
MSKVTVEITKTTKEKVSVEVQLPYFYKHDLLPDDCDNVIYGKICEPGIRLSKLPPIVTVRVLNLNSDQSIGTP